MSSQWIKPRYKITKEEFEQRYYGNQESLTSICKDFGIHQGSIAPALRKIGYKLRTLHEANLIAAQQGTKRTYTANYELFDNWSHEMAWVLGLLAADGCVQDYPVVNFVSTDKELLEKYRQAIGYTGPVWRN